MEDFAQGMMERQWPVPAARNKPDTPANKRGGAQDEGRTEGSAIQQQINDNSPNKRLCLQEISNQINSDSADKRDQPLVHLKKNRPDTEIDSESTNTMNASPRKSSQELRSELEPSVPPMGSQRSRFAALADRCREWEDDLSHHSFRTEEKKPSKADRYRYPQADISKVVPSVPSSDHPRPNPRSSSGSNSQDKEVVVESLQNEKVQAPEEKDKSNFLSVPQCAQTSPMRRAGEEAVASPLVLEIPQKLEAVENGESLQRVKEIKEIDITGAVSAIESTDVVEATEAVSITLCATNDAPTAVSGLHEKFAVTNDCLAMTSGPSRDSFHPTQKREASSRNVFEEPTKKPVSARLAAWQSKIAAAEDKPSAGVRTWEVKFVGGGGKTWTQSPKAAGRNATPLAGGPSVIPQAENFPSAEASSQESVQRNSWKESAEKRGAGLLPAEKNLSPSGIRPTTQVQFVPNQPLSRSPEEEQNRLRTDSEGKSKTIILDISGIVTASLELDTIGKAIGEDKQLQVSGRETEESAAVSCNEKPPEVIARPAPTPRASVTGGGLYSLIRKSIGGAQALAVAALSSVTPVLPSVPCLPEDDESETERPSVRDRSEEAKVDSLDDSADFKDSDVGIKESSAPTSADDIRELNSSEQSKSTDAGSQPSEMVNGTTEETTDETKDSDKLQSDPNVEEEVEEGDDDGKMADGSVSDLMDEAMDELDEGSAAPFVEPLPTPGVAPSVQQEPSPKVVMRNHSSGRKRTRAEDDSEPRGYISLQQYRQQTSRPKSQPPGTVLPQHEALAQKRATVMADMHCATSYDADDCNSPMRNPRGLHPDLVDLRKAAPEKPVKQRIQELQDMVDQELNVIQQTSNALNQCCQTGSMFSGSAEAVECHRLLLMACKKRETYLLEIQRLKEQPSAGGQKVGAKGRLTIGDLRLLLKSEFTDKFGTVRDTSVHYFIVMIRHGADVIFTRMVSSPEAAAEGSVNFPNVVSLPDVEMNFVVELEVYSMSVARDTAADPVTPKKSRKGLSQRKLTPKKLVTPKLSRPLQSPGGPTAVLSTNFTNIASLQLVMSHVNKTHFTLSKVPFSSPLQGSVHLRLNCTMETQVEEQRGFLTMFEDVGGFGSWHRRWCVLRGGRLSFWKYPDEEKIREPMGVVDLKECVSECIDLVSRDECARPNTFEVVLVTKQEPGTPVAECHDAPSTVKRWISADTKEERLDWCARLNETLANLRAWHSDALRPIKSRAQKEGFRV